MIQPVLARDRFLTLRAAIIDAQAEAEYLSLGLCVVHLAGAIRDIEERLRKLPTTAELQ